jgi:hypothetical protein
VLEVVQHDEQAAVVASTGLERCIDGSSLIGRKRRDLAFGSSSDGRFAHGDPPHSDGRAPLHPKTRRLYRFDPLAFMSSGDRRVTGT